MIINAERRRPADTDDRLSKPLATGYLTVVACIWLAHIAVIALSLATGRSSWATDNLWIVIPGLVILLAAFSTVWRINRVLHPDRPWFTEPFRIVGLAYGSAAPTAWRRLRSTTR